MIGALALIVAFACLIWSDQADQQTRTRKADPPMQIFTREQDDPTSYTDYVARANYHAAGAAVRFTLTRDNGTQTWYVLVEQEVSYGNWEDVITRAVPEAEALAWLTIEQERIPHVRS